MGNSDVIQGHFLEGVFHGPARYFENTIFPFLTCFDEAAEKCVHLVVPELGLDSLDICSKWVVDNNLL